MYLNFTSSNEELLSVFNASATAEDAVDPTLVFGPQRDSLLIVIPITIAYSFIFIIGLVGNVFTCIVIIKNKSMHTATNYYLFSLAISDLLLLISGMPQEMYSIWYKWPYVFGGAFCLLRGLAAEMSTNASIATITLFTIERYLAICHPFQSHTMSKLSRATKHIVILWLFALAFALPQALQFGIRYHSGVPMCLLTRVIIDHSFEISTGFFFCAPILLISVLYLLIGLRLRNTSKERVSQDLEQCISVRTLNLPRRNSKSTKRVINMLVAVVVAFVICWAPFHAQRLLYIYGTTEDHLARSPVLLTIYGILTYSSGILYYVSTCINPILYHIMSNKFRVAFKNTLVWCCAIKPAQIERVPCSTLAFARVPTSRGSANSVNNAYRKETAFHEKTSFDDSGHQSSESSSGYARRSITENKRLVCGGSTFCHHRLAELTWKEEENRFNILLARRMNKSSSLATIHRSSYPKGTHSLKHSLKGELHASEGELHASEGDVGSGSLNEVNEYPVDELTLYWKEVEEKIRRQQLERRV